MIHVLIECFTFIQENLGRKYFEGDIFLTAEQRRVIGRGRFIKKAAQIARNWSKGEMIYAIDGRLDKILESMTAIVALTDGRLIFTSSDV